MKPREIARVRDVGVLQAPHGHHSNIIADTLGVDIERGLSDIEAERRLQSHGTNTFEREAVPRWWRVFFRQFNSVVVWLLLAATVVAWLTNGPVEAVAIFVVLLINAFLGFAIEWRAGRALDALRKASPLRARVRRNGHDTSLDAENLVPGDIILVAAGDKIPADVRLIEEASLFVDESALTGESLPVQKKADSVAPASILADRRCMLYLGTIVTAGRGIAVVTATGTRTELGKIGEFLTKTPAEKTPLERKLDVMGRILVFLVLGIAAVVMIAGIIRGINPGLMFEISVSLAVAAVPEALPAMTTLILALGVLRMAKHRAIVRRLSAVEALGSTTVICADKTGTLTENKMTVVEYRLPNGRRILPGHPKISCEALLRLLRVSVLCNDASLRTGGDNSQTAGDPTELALLAGAKMFDDVDSSWNGYTRVREIPFDSATKRMITVNRHVNSGKLFAELKGGPSAVLSMCDTAIRPNGYSNISLDVRLRRKIDALNQEMAGQGMRVLGFAEKEIDRVSDDLESGYTFLGFAGMTDPPRHGVKRAIRMAQDGGIRVVMLTGDQLITASAVANQLNLSGENEIRALHAAEISGLDQAGLAEAARHAHVFARVSPEDKLRIVEALQQAGEIVAVTGDGINDAPALKRSDIGVAMGLRGTEVAKEAADIVLTDDNFATIVKAIEGGRTIYANIIKFVHLMFSHNLGEVLIIFAAILIGLPLPLLPLQILWMNLVTDVFPAFALAMEPASRKTMKIAPRSANETLLSGRFLMLIGWQGIMLALIALAAYVWALQTYGEGPHSRTIALLGFLGVQFGHMFNCRSRTRSAFDGFFSNPFIFAAAALFLLLQVGAFAVAPLAQILDLTRPNLPDLLVAVLCVLLPVLIVESVKLFGRSRSKSQFATIINY